MECVLIRQSRKHDWFQNQPQQMKPLWPNSAPAPWVEPLRAWCRLHYRMILLILTTLLFIVLVVLTWAGARQPRLSPGLSFLGYTNKPFTSVAALVLLTNGSGVPLEILPQMRAANVLETNGEFFTVPGLTTPWPKELPRLVQPGQTTVLDIHLNSDFREPWWTEVATRPQLRPSRLRDYAAGIRQPTLRRWAQRLYPPVETTWTKLGPFTNLPLGWVRVVDGSARRR